MDKITLTPAAQDKAQELLEREGRDDLMLRVSVQPGGCSGLIHQLFFDARELDGDDITEYDNGVRFAVDRLSAPYLQGASVNFVDDISQQGFVIENLDTESTCACGGSFA